MLQIAPTATPRKSRRREDPAFVAIKEHIEAMNAFSQAVLVQSQLEDSVAKESRTWHPIDGEPNRRAPAGCQDAPEWIAANINYWRVSRANDAALLKFLKCRPTTVAGALAMLEHAGSPQFPEERAQFKSKHPGREVYTETVMQEAFIAPHDAADEFLHMIAAVLRDLI